MSTHGCRSSVVVLIVVTAFFLLQACGGGSNNGGNPGGTAPSIVAISPTSVAAGAAGFTLTVTGANFLSTSTVKWNGASLATTYVSATQLTAAVESGRLAAGAAVTITVVTPGTTGGTSSGVSFTVNNPVPVLTDLAPSWAGAGSSGFPLTVEGSGFSSGSVVHWNGAALTTTCVSGNELTASLPTANLASVGTANVTVVTPSPGGGTSTAVVFTIGAPTAGTNHITSLNMAATGMVWDASRGRIYAAAPASAANGNSIVAINPVTGAAATPVFVGSDPNQLALSSDAAHLWVSLDGASAIKRLALPTLTSDLTIALPSSWHGPQVALATQAAPVSPNTLAVILGDRGLAPPDLGGAVIYDGAVQRPATIPGTSADMTWLQWGPDDSTLYGQNGGDSGANFYVMNVDATGVRMGTNYWYIFSVAPIQSHYDPATGRVYADDGRVFAPSTGELAGTFNLRDFHSTPVCLPDPGEPIVFCLGRDANQVSANAGLTLRAFDKNTYRQLGNLQIPGATGSAQNLIRWGRAGVAFNTIPVKVGDTAGVYLVDGPFVSSSVAPDFTSGPVANPLPVLAGINPESATVGSPGLVLTVSGSEFQPTATVYWNGGPLVTTYGSSTQLQAVVPASELAQAASATVSVANETSSRAVNSLAFTILPASSGLIARNLSSLDIAWDAYSSRLYAPVWSADFLYPNSVVAIDPASGSISKVAGVGADPHIVRISRDGTLGYTGYLDANLATQFHVPALDSMMSWSLGTGSFSGPLMAMDIQAAPDTPQTTAIALGTPTFLPEAQGLAIFDNGTARPQRPAAVGNLYDTIQWGLTDSLLYAADNESTGFSLYTLGVDATGAALLRTDRSVLTRSHATIHFDRGTGYLYADDGYATDPATGAHLGGYNARGLLVPDSSLNRVFILGQTASQNGTSNYTIFSFDQSSFASVSSLTLGHLVGTPVAITRWGASGLAIVTCNSGAGPDSGPAGMLYILDAPTFISATQPSQESLK